MIAEQIADSLLQVKEPVRGKRIVIHTYGSLGDLHPYIAIGLELRARGHQVIMAISKDYQSKIAATGLDFYPVRPDADTLTMTQDWALVQALSERHRDSEYIIAYILMPHLRSMYRDLKQAITGADLLLTHHLSFVSALLAETTGIAWASSILSPCSFMSAYDLPNHTSSQASAYEQALALVTNDTMLRHFRWQSRFFSATARQLRADLDLLPSGDPIFEGQHSPNLVLALFSSVLASFQPDWPAKTRITGFPFYDQKNDNHTLSPELEAFLAAGEPPIVFTLGSLYVLSPGNFYLEGARAAQQLGYRAVLLVGSAAPSFPLDQLTDGIMVVDYAPHSQIFPRAVAIVHHGGVGTTGQALQAGKPMLVVPYAHDQPDNAARLVRLGVARTISVHDCHVDRMIKELAHLLFDPKYAIKAAQVSQQVQTENGAVTAANALETYLNSHVMSL